MNTKQRLIFILIVSIVGIGTWAYMMTNKGSESTDDASFEAHIVSICPKVSGYVIESNIKDNLLVKTGDVLITIDPKDYDIRLHSALANLQSLQAKLQTATEELATTKISAPSNTDSAQSQVDAMKANWEKTNLNLKRMQQLDDSARTQQELDDAVTAEESAKALWEEAKARLEATRTAPLQIATAESKVNELKAQVREAEAKVAATEKDWTDTKILAPIDGKVTKRSVEIGSYVQPGQQLFELVETKPWIVANFKETQITKMQQGQRAEIDIDAYPHHPIKGHVDSFQAGTGSRFSTFPPENATGNFVKIVQRIPVKIILDEPLDPSWEIGPGMSVTATVFTK